MADRAMITRIQRKLMYRPLREKVKRNDRLLISGEIKDVLVPTDDGLRLHGWHSVAHEGPQDRPLCLFFPGNSGHRGCRVRDLELFNRLGCDALLVDYRGYGENPGSPCEPTIAADAHAIWRYVIEKLHTPSDRIIILGNSLGGGVATRLVMELCEQGTPPAGLVLRGTFSSMTDAAKAHYPWLPVQRFLVDRYPSIERVPHITCPIMLIHGSLDRVLPIEQGRRLFEAAPARSASGIEKRFVELPHAGHNDMVHIAAEEMAEALGEFIWTIFPEDRIAASDTPESMS
ncbi:MAG: alpha/beta fold hydrolase [Planctomycetaceae bacterium]|nr:alpha/beta fold hydrolase [Planctomycetaceae bacterium]